MTILLGLLLLTCATAGFALVKAGRDIETADADGPGPVAGFVDGRLQRTRTAVDTLMQPDLTVAEVRPSRHALRERATTYLVFGVGLVGIAAFLAVGLFLLDG